MILQLAEDSAPHDCTIWIAEDVIVDFVDARLDISNRVRVSVVGPLRSTRQRCRKARSVVGCSRSLRQHRALTVDQNRIRQPLCSLPIRIELSISICFILTRYVVNECMLLCLIAVTRERHRREFVGPSSWCPQVVGYTPPIVTVVDTVLVRLVCNAE